MQDVKHYIGFDIGGTKCAQILGRVTDGYPEVVVREEFPTKPLSPEDVLNKFSTFVKKYESKTKICGIGISCGGPLDSKRGIIMSPPSLPSWDNIGIVEYFENKFGIKTYLQNDANACAVAEWRFGAGKGCENVIFLTFGTGFGAGLILNGRLYAGTSDNAGEVGHVRLTKSGPVGYRKSGSCEGYCSGSGMVRLAKIIAERKKYVDAYESYIAEIGDECEISAKTLAVHARKGNDFCLAVYKKSGEMLGVTLSMLIDLFNPQKIIIGGVYMRACDLLYPHAAKVMKKECLSFCLNDVEICAAGLGERIGDFAALSIAQGGY